MGKIPCRRQASGDIISVAEELKSEQPRNDCLICYFQYNSINSTNKLDDTEGNYENHSEGIKRMRLFKRNESESLAVYQFRSIVDICKLNLSLVFFTTVCSFLSLELTEPLQRYILCFTYIHCLLSCVLKRIHYTEALNADQESVSTRFVPIHQT